ncbi:MAG: chemotaxis protein CheW [Verrucomicrobia bacterium]|jgi:chemotaxis-related protein WspB|nr:chemotaxis protein CheW [Verrucomicrobiota bacterium]
MLFLLFQIGNDRYALEASHAVEVIPLLALKNIPHAPRGVAGIFNYRGQPVTALDLCELTLGRPACERLSTRIIVVRYSREPNPPPTPDPRPSTLLGIIAEHATEMMRRDERDFVDSGVKVGSAPYLGPVLMDDKGAIQLLHAEHLLADGVRELLFAGTPGA